MCVLDIGRGPGDLLLLAARLVGPQSRVIGLDRSPETIYVAAQRAQRETVTKVQLVTDDVSLLGDMDRPVPAWLMGQQMEYPVDYGPDAVVYHWLAEALRSTLPTIARLGIATIHDVAIDTLAADSEKPLWKRNRRF
jgi:SAM-dependent methyltransferase